MKYIIDIPDECVTPDNRLIIPFTTYCGWDCDFGTGIKLNVYKEPDTVAIENEIRQKIENEVWHFAGILMDGFIESERRELTSGNSIFFDAYREVKARYDAKMSKRCKIKVGDECMYDSNKCVVTYVDPDNDCRVEVMFDNGTTYFDVDIYNLTHTGKHYPQLEEIFKQMRGE